MTRVMVIGNAGGGKSTLCHAVCAAHSLPYFAIDQIQWRPNWVRTSEEAFRQSHDDILVKDLWVIDGYGPMSSVEERLSSCDTVIFVDHPFRIHLWWATKRQIRSFFFGRPDAPDGCPMWRVTFRLYKMMWWLHREVRPTLVEMIYSHTDRIQIIHIKSPAELNAFAANPV